MSKWTAKSRDSAGPIPIGGEQMTAIRYPKEQMHRIKYTKLSKEQIEQKLVPAAAGPDCASEYSELLAGKSIRIVTDNGPILDYVFQDKRRLTVAENGGTPFESGYGALTLKQIVFFSHMVPKTQRGYNVVIDLKSDLATVFEVWFSGYKDNREVQRQMYCGYIEIKGKEAPHERHHLTNRVEGKVFHWTQDRGIETLKFYPSVIYSSFVELTRFGGELTFCGPSDFISIDENTYLYDRVECEFSGTLTMYVFDLLTVKQVGVRLGFDDTDILEYYMFRGEGEITGQLAQFEPFRDHGEKIVFGVNMPPMTGKGERPVYRPLLTNPPMTGQEVDVAIKKNIALFSPGNQMAGNKMPVSPFLVGKEFTIRCDSGGPVWNYRIDEIKKLRWRREGDVRWKEEIYEAIEPDEGVILFSHIHSGTMPGESVAIALDFANGLATCVYGKLGTKYMANEVTQSVHFGVIEMEGLISPRYDRHSFTDELVGRAFTWNYADNLTSMHVYSTPHSYSWTIFLDNGAGGMQWSSPCQYVKLREGLYLFTWVEEACNGHQSTIVFNTRTMHDGGFGYGVGKDGLSLNSMGAFARTAGFFDVKKYFGPK